MTVSNRQISIGCAHLNWPNGNESGSQPFDHCVYHFVLSEPFQPGHTFEDEGEHDKKCYACFLNEEVKSECSCGKCCHLFVEVQVEDAEPELGILERPE
jgi:hypothetical protein